MGHRISLSPASCTHQNKTNPCTLHYYSAFARTHFIVFENNFEVRTLKYASLTLNVLYFSQEQSCKAKARAIDSGRLVGAHAGTYPSFG